MTVVNLFSRSPWRITVAFDLPSPSVAPSDYAIARKDGGATLIVVKNAWLLDPNTVELALSAEMIGATTYRVVYQAGPANDVISRAMALPTPSTSLTEDPETELLGLDVDWTNPTLTASGDAPDIRGRACMESDLIGAAMIEPGELIHKPDEGAGANRSINSSATDAAVQALAARVKKQWFRDGRVNQPLTTVIATRSSSGEVTVEGDVTSVVNDDVGVKIALGSGG